MRLIQMIDSVYNRTNIESSRLSVKNSNPLIHYFLNFAQAWPILYHVLVYLILSGIIRTIKSIHLLFLT